MNICKLIGHRLELLDQNTIASRVRVYSLCTRCGQGAYTDIGATPKPIVFGPVPEPIAKLPAYWQQVVSLTKEQSEFDRGLLAAKRDLEDAIQKAYL